MRHITIRQRSNHIVELYIFKQYTHSQLAEVLVRFKSYRSIDHIPTLDPSKFDPEADYFYITLNNTIYGTRWTELPDTGNVPLVGDMSSSILSQEIDITKFGLLYAGAQKNLGPAGVTVVIVREDLLGNAMDFTPTMLRYDIHAENNSLYNTPPTYGIYFMGLVFDWVKRQSGHDALVAGDDAALGGDVEIAAAEHTLAANVDVFYGFLVVVHDVPPDDTECFTS